MTGVSTTIFVLPLLCLIRSKSLVRALYLASLKLQNKIQPCYYLIVSFTMPFTSV